VFWDKWWARLTGWLPAWARTDEVSRLVRYALVGGLTFALNMALLALLREPLGWQASDLLDNLANIFSTVCAVVFNYALSKRFVFRSRCGSRRALLREMLSFFGARGVTLLLDAGGYLLLVTALGASAYWSKLALFFVVLLLNYVFSKVFVFKQRTEDGGQKTA
jgi:putative flippase GtrA